eukprot:1101331_1
MSDDEMTTKYDEVQYLKTKLQVGRESNRSDNATNMSFQCEIGKNRFPFSVVWGSLPCLTWLCPIIGHLGITDSKGQIHDFAGPYTICIDDFMTGPVIKYWQIDPRNIDFPSLKSNEARNHSEAWDLALQCGDAKYKTMMHTLCWNNCHSHVRYVFNMMGIRDPTMIMFIKFMWHCKYVSYLRMFAVYLPFLIIVVIKKNLIIINLHLPNLCYHHQHTMSCLILFFIALSSLYQTHADEVICMAGQPCSCPETAPSPGEFCVINCGREDLCKAQPLTCRAGTPCYVRCEAKNACSETTMINAHGATDVTVVCAGDSACKDHIEIICGSGDCELHCADITSCESFGTIYTDAAKGFKCSGLYCPEIGTLAGQIPAPFSASPTASPSVDPTPKPSDKPTEKPTANPIETPSTNPTANPTNVPTVRPTEKPTNKPTDPPVAIPTLKPSSVPTPSPVPTKQPTTFPTSRTSANPTKRPTNEPSVDPTQKPTNQPTNRPTPLPSVKPTANPISLNPNTPTARPTTTTTTTTTTDKPTPFPTNKPTDKPTNKPTDKPTEKPTKKPTKKPTAKPIETTTTLKPSVATTLEQQIEETDFGIRDLAVENKEKGQSTAAIVAAVTGICFMIAAFGWFLRHRYGQENEEGKTSKASKDEVTLIDENTEQNQIDLEMETIIGVDVNDGEFKTQGGHVEEPEPEDEVNQNDAVMTYTSENDVQGQALISADA